MSVKNKSTKIITVASSTLNEENELDSKTYLDSIYNSKLSQSEKENINGNFQPQIFFGKNIQKQNKSTANNKEKNFYKALKIINSDLDFKDNNQNQNISSTFNISKGSKNLLSRISEFSEVNVDKSKDENISKYLHHPITKDIIKLGNQIIKTRNYKSYKINNGLEINKPLVSAYNMKNIFEKFNTSYIELENSNTNSRIFDNEMNCDNINENEVNINLLEYKKERNNKTKNKSKKKKIKYFHKKNRSSITNYYFSQNTSSNTNINYNNCNKKNNRYIIHYKDNISTLIGGGQNKINFKDKDSTTTNTKEEYLKDMQIHEVNDINININIFNNNRDLEVISDFDETKENKIYSTNKKNERNNTSNKKEIIIKNEYNSTFPKNIFNIEKKGKTSTESKKFINVSNQKQLNIVNLTKEDNNRIKTFNKAHKLSGNKTLRKKYERTEFTFRYVDNFFELNNNSNNFIMKNLMNKFDKCSQLKNKTIENLKNDFIETNLNLTNKINDTVIIKESENGLILNLEVSMNSESFIKNYNIQENEITSISEKNMFNENSKNSIRSALNNIKTNINYDDTKIKNNKSADKISNSFSLSLNSNDSLNIKKLNTYPKIFGINNKENKYKYSSPTRDQKGIKVHSFFLDSPFIKNELDISKSYLKRLSIKNQKHYNDINNNKSINSNKTDEVNNEFQPQSVYDYTFYQKLLEAEEKMIKLCKIASKNQTILDKELRLEILLWMMKTCEEFAFKRDTYHNSCYYFDMYLINNYGGKKAYDKNELELIGVTCIIISAKIEEIQLPRLKEYVELLSKNYTIASIIEMEKKICSSLSWKLIIITKNIWLSWYMCQWDLFIDTIDNIKEDLLKLLKEDDILYYKKPNDNSYYNFRKITQLIDIMVLDYSSYSLEPRKLIAASFFILICHNYKLKYNFEQKKMEISTPLSDLLFDIYDKFLTQSFDFNFNDENIQDAIKYCYNFINFHFIYDLPLLYQVHQSKLDSDSYEDFLSYQTTNDNYYQAIKERINIYK